MLVQVEDKDRPKEAKQHRLPALPNVVRKSRPAGNAHFRLHNIPEPVESDTYEVRLPPLLFRAHLITSGHNSVPVKCHQLTRAI